MNEIDAYYIVKATYPKCIYQTHLFCSECEWPCIPDEIQTHLQRQHPSIQTSKRKIIVQEIENIPGLIRKYTLPVGRAAIPYIDPPKPDGLQCRICGHVIRQVGHMQLHNKAEHGWINDWKKGGNIKAKLKEPRQLPWVSGVWCQRLFPSRAASSWFAVKGRADIGVSIVENEPISYIFAL